MVTRRLYNRCVNPRAREVRRLLDRYLVEVVEAYELCPWARTARLGGELAVDIVFETPTLADWIARAEALLARPTTRVAMIVAPDLAGSLAELRAIRDAVAARVRTAGVAEFHPDAAFDATTPARLVPALRRSPFAMLQLVPLAILDAVRAAPPPPALVAQAQMLGGHAPLPRDDIASRIAAANHARVRREELEATLADIFADRDLSMSR
jgi:hypothetical protein